MASLTLLEIAAGVTISAALTASGFGAGADTGYCAVYNWTGFYVGASRRLSLGRCEFQRAGVLVYPTQRHRKHSGA